MLHSTKEFECLKYKMRNSIFFMFRIDLFFVKRTREYSSLLKVLRVKYTD